MFPSVQTPVSQHAFFFSLFKWSRGLDLKLFPHHNITISGAAFFMDTLQKLDILSEDSQYDLACACGTGKEDRRRRGLDGKWLYPVPLTRGGYGIMLKTLLSNACGNDCRYCPLRSLQGIQPRAKACCRCRS